MKNLPLSNQRLSAFCLYVLLVGVFFASLPSLVIASEEPSLTVFSIDGLVFETYPEFEYIDFHYTQEHVRTIHIENHGEKEVAIESYSFDNREITLTTVPEVVSLQSPQPTETPTPTPTTSPIPTASPTRIPSPVITLMPTATPTPTSAPTATPTSVQEVQSVTALGDGVWDALAKCESGNNWSINTGNGYFGGLQFSQSAWESVGGTGSPASASREEQIEKAKKLQERRGWGAWGDCAKRLGLN